MAPKKEKTPRMPAAPTGAPWQRTGRRHLCTWCPYPSYVLVMLRQEILSARNRFAPVPFPPSSEVGAQRPSQTWQTLSRCKGQARSPTSGHEMGKKAPQFSPFHCRICSARTRGAVVTPPQHGLLHEGVLCSTLDDEQAKCTLGAHIVRNPAEPNYRYCNPWA